VGLDDEKATGKDVSTVTKNPADEMIEELERIKAKQERGEKLTEEEIEWVKEKVRQMHRALRPLKEAMEKTFGSVENAAVQISRLAEEERQKRADRRAEHGANTL
jgi:hypothetical protein